jgi:hypothetical protein
MNEELKVLANEFKAFKENATGRSVRYPQKLMSRALAAIGDTTLPEVAKALGISTSNLYRLRYLQQQGMVAAPAASKPKSPSLREEPVLQFAAINLKPEQQQPLKTLLPHCSLEISAPGGWQIRFYETATRGAQA